MRLTAHRRAFSSERMNSRLMGVPPGVRLRGRDVGRRRPALWRHALSARIHSAAASAAGANLRPERLKSRLTARRRAFRANEFAPDGRTARRPPARTRCRPAQAGLVAARPFGPNSCGGCSRRTMPEQTTGLRQISSGRSWPAVRESSPFLSNLTGSVSCFNLPHNLPQATFSAGLHTWFRPLLCTSCAERMTPQEVHHDAHQGLSSSS